MVKIPPHVPDICTLLFSPRYKTWQPKAKNCPICHDFKWDLGTSLLRVFTFAPGEGWSSSLIVGDLQVPPCSCSPGSIQVRGCGNNGEHAPGQGILHPLRSSPRVLRGSGFKAGESLHLMWNTEPAGIVSHSLHLFPHAPMPVYPSWFWCLPQSPMEKVPKRCSVRETRPRDTTDVFRS